MASYFCFCSPPDSANYVPYDPDAPPYFRLAGSYLDYLTHPSMQWIVQHPGASLALGASQITTPIAQVSSALGYVGSTAAAVADAILPTTFAGNAAAAGAAGVYAILPTTDAGNAAAAGAAGVYSFWDRLGIGAATVGALYGIKVEAEDAYNYYFANDGLKPSKAETIAGVPSSRASYGGGGGGGGGGSGGGGGGGGDYSMVEQEVNWVPIAIGLVLLGAMRR